MAPEFPLICTASEKNEFNTARVHCAQRFKFEPLMTLNGEDCRRVILNFFRQRHCLEDGALEAVTNEMCMNSLL